MLEDRRRRGEISSVLERARTAGYPSREELTIPPAQYFSRCAKSTTPGGMLAAFGVGVSVHLGAERPGVRRGEAGCTSQAPTRRCPPGRKRGLPARRRLVEIARAPRPCRTSRSLRQTAGLEAGTASNSSTERDPSRSGCAAHKRASCRRAALVLTIEDGRASARAAPGRAVLHRPRAQRTSAPFRR